MSEASFLPKLKTAFTNLPRFPDDDESKMKTQELVAASTALVNLIAKLGNTFSPIIDDMIVNIQTIYIKFQEDPNSNQFLLDMILKEQRQGSGRKITKSVLWLGRELQFFNLFFAIVLQDSSRDGSLLNLTEYILTAYQHTLQDFKGCNTHLIRTQCRKYPPNKTNYMTILALGRPGVQLQVIEDWRVYYQQLNACVQKLVYCSLLKI